MSRRPVIAIVTDAIHPYNFGGREIRYHELAKHIAERAEVHVFTMRWWDGPRVYTEGPITFHAISPLMPFYRGPRRSIRQALVFALATLRIVGKRFDVLKVDHMPHLQLFPLWLVASLRRKPLIATWHEVWGPEYWRDYLGPKAGRVGWWVEWLSMRLPDHIIAASEETADRVRSMLGGRTDVTVAPNGIDLKAARNAPPAEDRTDVVVVSRLMQHKRLDMLLESIALLHEKDIPVTCRIIGDGPERDALHEQADQLGLGDAVDFQHDVTDQHAVYSMIKAAQVFAFPSMREGFGIAALEAIACGVPVVTTSAPDNLAQHLVARSQDGVVCEPTPEAFSAALHDALTRGRNSPEEDWLGEYAWEEIAEQVIGTFHR
ncbi:glycosyltransferase family 4 protein [Planotetraspora sp. GP83]|uniref:glycosyltransferase family 4 protein n=1 Tax=Planotetraspora sp. GP83 TaxID=3156264 RepID=UPI0035188535